MADYTDFDFDETQRAAWGEFADRLDEVLSVMDSTADLTISVTSTSAAPRPGIRFTVREPGIVTALVNEFNATRRAREAELNRQYIAHAALPSSH